MKLISSIVLLIATIASISSLSSPIDLSTSSPSTSLFTISALIPLKICTPVQPMAPDEKFCKSHNASPGECKKMLGNYARFKSCQADRERTWMRKKYDGDVNKCDPSKNNNCRRYYENRNAANKARDERGNRLAEDFEGQDSEEAEDAQEAEQAQEFDQDEEEYDAY
jgi:hypothetical protein